MRCSANRLLQLATKPRLQSIRSEASSHVWPSASSNISRARRAPSARSVRLLARRVSSMRSAFVRVMASVMDAIIVYKWLLQSTSRGAMGCELIRSDCLRGNALVLEQPPQEFKGCVLVTSPLHEDIQDLALVVDRAP